MVKRKSYIRYSPQTGMMYTSNGPCKRRCKDGYVRVWYKGSERHVHRVAWTIVNGEIPKGGYIDHINRNPADNRIVNLRLSSMSENQRNKLKQRHNKSGWKGVHWCKSWRKWVTCINYEGKNVHIGGSNSLGEAILMYNIFVLSMHSPYTYVNQLPDRHSTEWKDLFTEREGP